MKATGPSRIIGFALSPLAKDSKQNFIEVAISNQDWVPKNYHIELAKKSKEQSQKITNLENENLEIKKQLFEIRKMVLEIKNQKSVKSKSRLPASVEEE